MLEEQISNTKQANLVINSVSFLKNWRLCFVPGSPFVKVYHKVLQNKGAAGVDGVLTKELPSYLLHNWENVKDELLTGIYQLQLIKGVTIPKGSGDYRKLGIPTVLDRLVQQSIHQVWSPIWEKEFLNNSFGFRPRRNAQQALIKASGYINSGKHWIIDLDLKSFFDRVNHDYLISLINKRVKDKILLQLKGKYLKEGILEKGVKQKRRISVAQLNL